MDESMMIFIGRLLSNLVLAETKVQIYRYKGSESCRVSLETEEGKCIVRKGDSLFDALTKACEAHGLATSEVI